MTATYSSTATQTATETATETATVTLTSTETLTPVPATFTFTFSPTPTSSGTPTQTLSVVPTIASPGAKLWPNPLYPDRGEVFHLGNVTAGSTWTVYDMIGKFVRKGTTTGDPAIDVWNGLNANGVEVTTGIYILVLDGHLYRVAVVRN